MAASALLDREITLTLRRPHRGQAAVIEHAARFNVVACGRRWGKTTLGEDRTVRPLLAGVPVAWFSPTYKSLTEVWERLTALLQPVTDDKSEQDHRLRTVTGGVLDCWSLEQPDGPRGRAYARVLVDEAAHAAHLEYAWTQVIRPTLTDRRGDAWFLSTPNGRNYFHTLYQRGQDASQPEWASWQKPSVENPHVPEAEIAAARDDVPERVFAQEYLAAFLDDGAGVFRGVDAAATEREDLAVRPGHAYVIGCDWGKLDDFTVLSVVDATDRRQVCQDRFNKIDYAVQLAHVRALSRHFRRAPLVAERNAMGEPLIDQLRREGISVTAFTTSNTTKGAAVEDLVLALERRELAILDEPVLLAELKAFAAERLPSGVLRYAAPAGMHDDTVMALALAWQGAKRSDPLPEPTRYAVGAGSSGAAAARRADSFERALATNADAAGRSH